MRRAAQRGPFALGRFGNVAEWQAVEPRFAAGDADARDWVIERAATLCLTIVVERNGENAVRRYDFVMDLASDATIEAIRRIDRWTGSHSLRAHVMTSCRYACLEAWGVLSSRGERLPRPLADWDVDDEFMDRVADERGSSGEAEPDLAETVGRALDCLAPKERDAVRAVYGIDGREYRQKEYASAIGVSEASISMRLSGGLRKLADYFAVRGLTYDAI